MEVDILIGKGICSSCSPVVVLQKDESPPVKWGVIFRVRVQDNTIDIFICNDCLQSLVNKSKEIEEKQEKEKEKYIN